jgi:hypothetical protein
MCRKRCYVASMSGGECGFDRWREVEVDGKQFAVTQERTKRRMQVVT